MSHEQNYSLGVFQTPHVVSAALCPIAHLLSSLPPPQSFHCDSHSPDVYTGADVGVWNVPIPKGQHRRDVYLQHPQQPAGSSCFYHALPAVQTGRTQIKARWHKDKTTTVFDERMWDTSGVVLAADDLLPSAGERGVCTLLFLHLQTREEILRPQQYQPLQQQPVTSKHSHLCNHSPIRKWCNTINILHSNLTPLDSGHFVAVMKNRSTLYKLHYITIKLQMWLYLYFGRKFSEILILQVPLST